MAPTVYDTVTFGVAKPDDDYTPHYVGDLDFLLRCRLTDRLGNVEPLTGATGWTLHFRNRSNGTVIQGNGTFSNMDTVNGLIFYQWGGNEVATVGFYDMQIGASFSGAVRHWDSRVIEIRATF